MTRCIAIGRATSAGSWISNWVVRPMAGLRHWISSEWASGMRQFSSNQARSHPGVRGRAIGAMEPRVLSGERVRRTAEVGVGALVAHFDVVVLLQHAAQGGSPLGAGLEGAADAQGAQRVIFEDQL